MDPSRGDSRYNLNYSMSSIGLTLSDQVDMYGNPTSVSSLGARPPSGGLIQSISGNGGGGGGGGGLGLSPRGLMPNTSQCQTLVSNSSSVHQRGIKRSGSDCYEEQQQQQQHRNSGGGGGAGMSHALSGMESCGMSGGNSQQQQQQQQHGNNQQQTAVIVPDGVDDSYVLQHKKSPPANGKKTKGRVKIKMEYIDNKLRRYTTFSKRKTGIMKKAYELSTLTGTQVMLLVASETGHVYTFATRKLQPMITSEAGKQLIQTCLNSPDPPNVGSGDQRMSATGFEETELSYNIADEDSKEDRSSYSTGHESDDSSDLDSPVQNLKTSNMVINTGAESAEVQRGSGGAGVSYSSNFKNSTNELNSPFPFSSVADLPQNVILQLIKSGQLQLHTENGGQYLTIPLPTDRVQMTGNDLRLSSSTSSSTSSIITSRTTKSQANGENYHIDNRRKKHVKSALLPADIKQEKL